MANPYLTYPNNTIALWSYWYLPAKVSFTGFYGTIMQPVETEPRFHTPCSGVKMDTFYPRSSLDVMHGNKNIQYLLEKRCSQPWKYCYQSLPNFKILVWVRSWKCGSLVTWFFDQLIAKPGNTTAASPWPDPLYDNTKQAFQLIA